MAWWTVDLAISIEEQLENSKNVRGNLFFWECWIFAGTLSFWTLQGDLTKSSEHGRELEEFWPLKAIMAEDDS